MPAVDDEKFMRMALREAESARAAGEVPVGAVIARGGEVVAAGQNRRERAGNALLHAEVEAIGRACEKLRSWRLDGCTMYVTLEPCAMCAGAILNARIGRIVFGAYDEKAGACGSVADLFAMPFSYGPAVKSGVLRDDCEELLSDFFRAVRVKEQK